jgi:Uri superfamily endonuclease
VDYLRRTAEPLGAALRQADAPLECRWAALLADAPHWTAGPRGFGASDCRCPTHLFAWAATGGPTVADGLAGVLSYDLWLATTG